MVKINLLDLSEDKVILKKGAEGSTSEKATRDEREFSIESVDELFQTSQASKKTELEKPLPKQEEAKISEKPIKLPSKTPSEVYEESLKYDEESFDSPPNRKFYIFSGIFVVIIAAAVILYFYVFGDKSREVTQPMADATTEVQEPEQPPAQAEPRPAVNQGMLNLFSRNKAENAHGLNVARQLMNFSQNNTQFALMVLTPDQIQFTILADSRDALTNYQSNMKQQFANMKFRMVNSEEMFTSGRTKILADFTLTPGEPGSIPPISNFREITTGNLQSVIKSLSQKHQLNLQYFKKGRQTSAREFSQTKYYTTLAGDVNTLMKFLQEVVDTYPAIGFSKIAFNPSNLGALGKGQITARITMILNEDRTS